MKLSEKQHIFTLNVAKLIIWCYEQGFELSFGETFRTIDQQRLYFEGYTLLKIGSDLKLAKAKAKSKTLHSKHLSRLAIDLNLFINGEYMTEKEFYLPLAQYWESLHEKNKAGYFWGWDANHFEMK